MVKDTPLHMLFSESSVRAVNRSILLDILLADRRVKIDEVLGIDIDLVWHTDNLLGKFQSSL
jgi:hypothetical protein